MNRTFPLLALSLLPLPLLAEIKLADPFTDHMVLQRDIPVQIWGTSQGRRRRFRSLENETQTAQSQRLTRRAQGLRNARRR